MVQVVGKRGTRRTKSSIAGINAKTTEASSKGPQCGRGKPCSGFDGEWRKEGCGRRSGGSNYVARARPRDLGVVVWMWDSQLRIGGDRSCLNSLEERGNFGARQGAQRALRSLRRCGSRSDSAVYAGACCEVDDSR